MKGRVFKRCSRCNATVPARRCTTCGSDRFTWAFIVDVGRASAGGRKQRRRQGFATKTEAERARASCCTSWTHSATSPPTA